MILWVGTNDSGVAVLVDGEFKMYRKSDGLNSSSIRSITEGNDGGQWLLRHACNTYEEFRDFAEGYYSESFDETLLKKLYENGTLSEAELSELLR